MEPTVAATVASPALPQTLSEGLSPAPVESNPTASPATGTATAAPAAGADVVDVDLPGVDTDSSGGGGGGGSGSDGTGSADSTDGFVFGTELSDSEKEDVIVGASVIGGIAVGVVVAACLAARFNSAVSGLDDADDEEEERAGGGNGRGRTRKSLPTFRISPSSSTSALGK